MAIEKIYRVKVNFETPEDYDDNVTNSIAFSDSTFNYNEFTGNAVCEAYIEFECESLRAAKKLETSLIKILSQSGCKIL